MRPFKTIRTLEPTRSSRYFPIRLMYVYFVIFATLFIMAFFWFAWMSAVTSLRGSIIVHMAKYENMSAYESWTLADQFVYNLWTFFLAIMMIGLLFYAILYAQRKGRQVWTE